MDEKYLLQLAQMMGGPNGRGVPLREEAVGLIEAGNSGVPLKQNDGRNRKGDDELERDLLRFKKGLWEMLSRERPPVEPTPVPIPSSGIADDLLIALSKGMSEYLQYKARDAVRRPLKGHDPEGKDTRPRSPDIAEESGGK